MRSKQISTEDVLNHIGNGLFQNICCGFFCGTTCAALAMHQVSLSMIIEEFSQQQSTPLDSNQLGLLNNIMFAGMMFGSLTIGYFADKYGRRKANVFANFICSFFGILQCLSTTYNTMLVCRLGLGLGVGSATALVFITSAEFTPTSYRTFFSGLLSVYAMIGPVIVPLLALVTVHRLGWKIYMLLTTIPSLIVLMGYIFYVPETPHFYMSIGNVEGAQNVLKWVAKVNSQTIDESFLQQLHPEAEEMEEEDPERIVSRQDPSINKQSILSIDEEDTDRIVSRQDPYVNKQNIFSIFKSPYTIVSIVLMSITFIIDITWASLNLWFPTILASINYFKVSIYVQSTFFYLIQLPGSIFGIFAVQWMGRKTMIIIFMTIKGLVLSSVLISPQNGILALVALAVAMAVFSILMNPISLLMVESYPTDKRGMASGFLYFVSYFGGFVGVYMTPSLLQIDQSLVFVVPGVLCLFAAAGSFLLKETKGQQLQSTDQRQVSYTRDESLVPLLDS
eukprot:TRINITY_DN1017_c0_g1_i5.p1 TRINITY_DN1017_c0_g1~~TRINITY_DN1017_c0_g1_i5.p1  ORF type:complete len:507 (-),score=34.88 TRINITY_DN1017_c0_g1_i5:320-1840(-)